jgi:16S rRNA (cytosine967-C5)-methyltransferase
LTSPSIIRNQQQTFLRLWQSTLPHVFTDRALPTRIQTALRRREFGSRDRRLYRELLYTAVRHLPWIEELATRTEEEMLRGLAWLAAETPATHDFRTQLTAGLPNCPADADGRAQFLGVSRPLMPEWFREHCPAAFVAPNLNVLLARSPVWIRLQTDATASVEAEFNERHWPMLACKPLPTAARILGEGDLTSTRAFHEGKFEIQDLGSQFILASAAVETGGCWLDACAGAGGKTLQLATLVGPAGRVDAHDVRPEALEELQVRARRGGFEHIRILERRPDNSLYDGVLVDAPCSGTGTWRRSPHLKWCTKPADIAAQAVRQGQLLAQCSRQVRPGGILLYATCSLSRFENTEVVRAFLGEHPEFEAELPAKDFGCSHDGTGLSIMPADHDTDGYFVSKLVRLR